MHKIGRSHRRIGHNVWFNLGTRHSADMDCSVLIILYPKIRICRHYDPSVECPGSFLLPFLLLGDLNP
jgi:hypothetical protein